MIVLSVTQLINGQWERIGNIQFYSSVNAEKYLELLKGSIEESKNRLLPLTQNGNQLMIINLDHGPVKFRIDM